MNTTSEHPAIHSHTPHMMYWGSVKEKAEDCVKHLLEGGNHPTTLLAAIGKSTIDSPDDWEHLMTYCKNHGAACHQINKLFIASANWLQAHNELEYKRLYPAM